VSRFTLSRVVNSQTAYLAACYEPQFDGIRYTALQADACSYVTWDKAVEVARTLHKLHGYDIQVNTVEN